MCIHITGTHDVSRGSCDEVQVLILTYFRGDVEENERSLLNYTSGIFDRFEILLKSVKCLVGLKKEEIDFQRPNKFTIKDGLHSAKKVH